MKLLLSQKNILYDLIQEEGLSSSSFNFVESRSVIVNIEMATNLIYKGTDYFFSFETGNKKPYLHYAIYCPGHKSHTEKVYSGDWNHQIEQFKIWLSNLKRELNTPNKWERLLKEFDALEINDQAYGEQDKFRVDEFEDLKIKIESLKFGIASLSLESNQIEVINSKLDHLSELAKSMNKFDWKGLFIGTILSIIIQLNVTPENANEIWKQIKIAFQSLLLL